MKALRLLLATVMVLLQAFLSMCTLIGLAVVGLGLYYHFHLRHPTFVNETRDTIVEALGCIDDPCVIKDNPGGDALTFTKAARFVRDGAIKLVVIDGRCASGCAYFADKTPPHLCITRKAYFSFHKGRTSDGTDEFIFDLIHSDDIQKWVTQQGGYPTDSMLVMKYKVAKKFWPTCPI